MHKEKPLSLFFFIKKIFRVFDLILKDIYHAHSICTKYKKKKKLLNLNKSFLKSSLHNVQLILQASLAIGGGTKSIATASTSSSSFNPRDRLKRKMQILLNKQC